VCLHLTVALMADFMTGNVPSKPVLACPMILPEFAPADRDVLVSAIACALKTIFASPARQSHRVILLT